MLVPMGIANPAPSAPATLTWHVPALVERPVVGTSCCASTAEALIASELFLLPGVIDLVVDVPGGTLTVVLDPRKADVSVVVDALGEIGYPPGMSLPAIGVPPA